MYPSSATSYERFKQAAFYSRATLEAYKVFNITPDIFQIHESFPAVSLIPDLFYNSAYSYDSRFSVAKEHIMGFAHTVVPQAFPRFEKHFIEYVLGINLSSLPEGFLREIQVAGPRESKDHKYDPFYALSKVAQCVGTVGLEHLGVMRQAFPDFAHKYFAIEDSIWPLFWMLPEQIAKGGALLAREELWRAKDRAEDEMLSYIENKYGRKLRKGRPTIVEARRFADFKWNIFFARMPGRTFGDKVLSGIHYLTADPESGGLGFNLIVGGKAHEDDRLSQWWVSQLKEFSKDPALQDRFLFSTWTPEDSVVIIRGAKVCLQTSIPPYEAAGMKDKKDMIVGNIVVSSYTGGPVQQITNVLHHGINGNGYLFEPYDPKKLQIAFEDLSSRLYAYIYTENNFPPEEIESPNELWLAKTSMYMSESPEGILDIMHNATRMLPVVDSRTAAMKFAFMYLKMLGMEMDITGRGEFLTKTLEDFRDRLTVEFEKDNAAASSSVEYRTLSYAISVLQALGARKGQLAVSIGPGKPGITALNNDYRHSLIPWEEALLSLGVTLEVFEPWHTANQLWNADARLALPNGGELLTVHAPEESYFENNRHINSEAVDFLVAMSVFSDPGFFRYAYDEEKTTPVRTVTDAAVKLIEKTSYVLAPGAHLIYGWYYPTWLAGTEGAPDIGEFERAEHALGEFHRNGLRLNKVVEGEEGSSYNKSHKWIIHQVHSTPMPPERTVSSPSGYENDSYWTNTAKDFETAKSQDSQHIRWYEAFIRRVNDIRVAKSFVSNVSTVMKGLDIGCGSGRAMVTMLVIASRLGINLDLHGIDISREAMQMAMGFGLPFDRLHQANLRTQAIPENVPAKFDFIHASDILPYFYNAADMNDFERLMNLLLARLYQDGIFALRWAEGEGLLEKPGRSVWLVGAEELPVIMAKYGLVQDSEIEHRKEQIYVAKTKNSFGIVTCDYLYATFRLEQAYRALNKNRASSSVNFNGSNGKRRSLWSSVALNTLPLRKLFRKNSVSSLKQPIRDGRHALPSYYNATGSLRPSQKAAGNSSRTNRQKSSSQKFSQSSEKTIIKTLKQSIKAITKLLDNAWLKTDIIYFTALRLCGEARQRVVGLAGKITYPLGKFTSAFNNKFSRLERKDRLDLINKGVSDIGTISAGITTLVFLYFHPEKVELIGATATAALLILRSFTSLFKKALDKGLIALFALVTISSALYIASAIIIFARTVNAYLRQGINNLLYQLFDFLLVKHTVVKNSINSFMAADSSSKRLSVAASSAGFILTAINSFMEVTSSSPVHGVKKNKNQFDNLRKCLVLDGDGVLWDGVIDEVGVTGVRITPAHRALQEFAKALKGKGALLAINSKNNRNDVLAVLDTHPDMILRRADFSVIKANWEDKPANMVKIAKELNIGIDSLVFLDDSPHERGLMRATYPEIFTVELTANVKGRLHQLSHLESHFISGRITEEDRSRTALYLEQKQRENLRSSSLTIDSYRRSLSSTMIIRQNHENEPYVVRMAQLTQRTNRFNTTLVRYTDKEIELLLQRRNINSFTMEMFDAKGSLGIVGFAIAESQWDPQGMICVVELLCISCRALAINIECERAFLSAIATEMKCKVLKIIYNQKEQNRLMEKFFINCGFVRKKARNKEVAWELDLENKKITLPEWIRAGVSLDHYLQYCNQEDQKRARVIVSSLADFNEEALKEHLLLSAKSMVRDYQKIVLAMSSMPALLPNIVVRRKALLLEIVYFYFGFGINIIGSEGEPITEDMSCGDLSKLRERQSQGMVFVKSAELIYSDMDYELFGSAGYGDWREEYRVTYMADGLIRAAAPFLPLLVEFSKRNGFDIEDQVKKVYQICLEYDLIHLLNTKYSILNNGLTNLLWQTGSYAEIILQKNISSPIYTQKVSNVDSQENVFKARRVVLITKENARSSSPIILENNPRNQAVNAAWQFMKTGIERFDTHVAKKKEAFLSRFYHAMQRTFEGIHSIVSEGRIDPFVRVNLMKYSPDIEDPRLYDANREMQIGFFCIAANPPNNGHFSVAMHAMPILGLDAVVVRAQPKMSYKADMPMSEKVSVEHRHIMTRESINGLWPLVRYTDLGSETTSELEGSAEMHRLFALNKQRKMRVHYILGAENEARMWNYMRQQYTAFGEYDFGSNPNHRVVFSVAQRGEYGAKVTKQELLAISMAVQKEHKDALLKFISGEELNDAERKILGKLFQDLGAAKRYYERDNFLDVELIQGADVDLNVSSTYYRNTQDGAFVPFIVHEFAKAHGYYNHPPIDPLTGRPLTDSQEKYFRMRLEPIARSIAEQIRSVVETGVPGNMPLISIDGGSGSGKTTIAEEAAKYLSENGIETIIIPLDIFLRDRTWRLAIQKLVTGMPLTDAETLLLG
ncbi:MAG: HAD-IIIC family phosphatase, partial [Candidatus Omnitrophota bacterium]